MQNRGTSRSRVRDEDKRRAAEAQELLQHARKKWEISVTSAAFDHVSDVHGDVYVLDIADGKRMLAWFDYDGAPKHGFQYRP